MPRLALGRILSPVTLAALAACGGAPSAPTARAAAEGGRILDARTGEPVAFDAFVSDLGAARVVYVGEEHDRPEDHEAQRAILVALDAVDPDAPLALGLEMVQRPFQPALDAWVRGEVSERELLEGVEWASRWGHDFGLYRSLFDAARERGARIVALNTPREVSRALGHGGLDALDEATRAALPELDLDDAAHRAMVMEGLRSHAGVDDAMLERFYLAQVVWDETMAETVAQTLRPEAPGAGPAPRRMLVVAGRYHVRQGLGIPRRAARRGAEPFRIVMPVSPEELEGLEAERAAGAPPVADYLWVRPS